MFKRIVIFTAICLWFPSSVMAAERLLEIKLGTIYPDKIQVLKIQDPDMPFITIYLTNIIAGNPLKPADPSDNSIAARLTGKITKIVKKMNPAVINLSKSIGWKTLKMARVWDEANQTVVYVTYSTKMIDGSLKHSVSAVPLGEFR